ncbi:hypothetical protein BU24DRAFT_456800 [Aaosphaeria arxii CBS 175.79]|uniref:Uncharacterized protein n=1 Tax=Aaosphaeria arxii CBS 175.79 TaxID=1450172 RepID=A0A6A5Y875_9PLEO|nr:uncharacterized protein BU24DRAFT_456800 [Aaosphaeria arxii CBS 175.79]KAF2020764.1 hypothetical protein BU24DRAFT_456800 [Aaosphaeria arxii CBS 175.79]
MLSALSTGFSLSLFLSCIHAAPGASGYGRNLPRAFHAGSSAPNPKPERFQLTIELCGIAGGYIATVLIWGILLLTIGRKMRRKTESTPKALELEIVTSRPATRSLASPLSARSATSWFKRGFKTKETQVEVGPTISSPTSPVVHSPGSFDQKVIDADRSRAQAEMERLYAAVAEHDRKKSLSQISMASEEVESGERKLPKLNTNTSRVQDREFSAYSNPGSPVKAIYPPGYNNGPPTAPLPRERQRNEQPPASPRSILSKKSHMSSASNSSRSRINLKNLRISGPIQKYPGGSDDEEARTPLSPRYYNPPAPPSPPTNHNSPTTPGTIEEVYEQLDEPKPLPRPAPQRSGTYSSYNTPTSATAPPMGTASANSSTRELPLRGYAEPMRSPDLRTTVLDRRNDKISMTTPKTSVPYTPYSPYMPFTPITPVTPHLVTKSDRKNMKKASKRRLAPHPEMIQSPKEIFGDAY